jgi:hypothetical protein
MYIIPPNYLYNKKTRTRDEKGRYVGDDPETPENEAWVISSEELETPPFHLPF